MLKYKSFRTLEKNLFFRVFRRQNERFSHFVGIGFVRNRGNWKLPDGNIRPLQIRKEPQLFYDFEIAYILAI